MSAARCLLREIRMKGAVVALNGERVRVNARRGVVTSEEQEALRATKPEVVSFLAEEERILGMSLSDFEKQDTAIEIRVDWLRETLWFVPAPTHADMLIKEGVRRGLIWTVKELTDLTNLPGVTRANIESIGRLKAGFRAEIVSVEQWQNDPLGHPVAPLEGGNRCSACHGTRFWRSIHGVVVCRVCHPPGTPALVAEWIDRDD